MRAASSDSCSGVKRGTLPISCRYILTGSSIVIPSDWSNASISSGSDGRTLYLFFEFFEFGVYRKILLKFDILGVKLVVNYRFLIFREFKFVKQRVDFVIRKRSFFLCPFSISCLSACFFSFTAFCCSLFFCSVIILFSSLQFLSTSSHKRFVGVERPLKYFFFSVLSMFIALSHRRVRDAYGLNARHEHIDVDISSGLKYCAMFKKMFCRRILRYFFFERDKDPSVKVRHKIFFRDPRRYFLRLFGQVYQNGEQVLFRFCRFQIFPDAAGLFCLPCPSKPKAVSFALLFSLYRCIRRRRWFISATTACFVHLHYLRNFCRIYVSFRRWRQRCDYFRHFFRHSIFSVSTEMSYWKGFGKTVINRVERCVKQPSEFFLSSLFFHHLVGVFSARNGHNSNVKPRRRQYFKRALRRFLPAASLS